MTDTSEAIPSSEPALATAGHLLRQARLSAGVHLAILSAALKVPVRTLEQLEADQLDGLGAPAFVRGLAGSVCRQLRVDPQPVLARLPQADSRLKPASASLGADGVNIRRPAASWVLPRLRLREPLVWVGLAMLSMTAILIWWPQVLQNPLGSIASEASEQKTVTEASKFPLPPEPVAAVAMGQATEVVQAPVVAVLPASSGAATQGTGASAATPAALTTADPVKSGVDAVLMAVSARSDSWVEVRDAAGQVLLSKLMKSGDRETIPQGQLVRVVIGRADAVSVEVRGKPFDLKPHTQVTVARFEVQP